MKTLMTMIAVLVLSTTTSYAQRYGGRTNGNRVETNRNEGRRMSDGIRQGNSGRGYTIGDNRGCMHVGGNHHSAPAVHHSPAPVVHHSPAPVVHHRPAPVVHHRPYHYSRPVPVVHHHPAPVYVEPVYVEPVPVHHSGTAAGLVAGAVVGTVIGALLCN